MVFSFQSLFPLVSHPRRISWLTENVQSMWTVFSYGVSDSSTWPAASSVAHINGEQADC
jgi:hypothetical protein